MKHRIAIFLIMFVCVVGQMPVLAQVERAFESEQYKEALWMVTRFYGGQRSGIGPNWLIMEHSNPAYRTSFTKDADGDYNLEGGWFDCGDHMLFGQTFFFTVYMLATAYEAFPEGFHDLYTGWNYSDYVQSQDWSIAGGKPNDMPDLLEELKYATDWIIKATPNENTFYYEKGTAAYDHSTWVTAGKMSTQPVNQGGEPRTVQKNPDDGRMASFAAAALAKMSRIYRKYDVAYADLCLKHAKNAYAYAKPRKDKKAPSASKCDGSPCYDVYSSNNPTTIFLTAAAEMYKTTGEAAYMDDITANRSARVNHWWAFDYGTAHDLAPYALAMALPDERTSQLSWMRTTFVNRYATGTKNDEKILEEGLDNWSALRYPANHAFVAALYSAATNTDEYDQFIYDQIDYILGSNKAKQSFLVGFCKGCEKEVKQPHHVNVYLNDNNTINNVSIPERNKYHGFLVGGSWTSEGYEDNINNYEQAEGGIDYNAGLLGALAYIVSKSVPADTSKFITSVKQFSSKNAVQKQAVSISQRHGMVLFSAAAGKTITSIGVYTLSGKQVFSHSGQVSEIAWKESSQTSGVYLAKIKLAGGEVVQHSVLLR